MKDMAAITHHLTVSSLTGSSSPKPAPTWNLNPLILSSAVILACLISVVVSAATVKDVVLSSDPAFGKGGMDSTGNINTIFSIRGNNNGSTSNHIRRTGMSLPTQAFKSSNGEDVKHFTTVAGTSLASRSRLSRQRLARRGHHTVQAKVEFSGGQDISEKKDATGSGLMTYLSMLDDRSSRAISSNFVNFASNAGISDLSNNGFVNMSISSQNGQGASLHGGTVPQSFTHAESDKQVESLMTLNTKEWKQFGFSYDIPNTEHDETPDNYVNIMGFKPLPLKLDSSTFTAQPKRYPRSIDKASEDDLISSTENELLSRALHNVDKLQTISEPCPPPSERIIILRPAKFKPHQFFPAFAEEVNKTVQIANTISDLLLYTKSPPEDFMDVFFAMTQSLVETGPQVTGCAIAFSLVNSGPLGPSTTPVMSPTSPPSSGPSSTARVQPSNYNPQSLFPYSYRTREGAVVVTDLSMLYRPQTTTWFSVHINRSTEGLLKPKNRIYANKTDIGNLTFYKAKWNSTVSVTPEDGYWARPYYDCLLRNWVIQYSVPFYQLEGTTPEFKGVVLLEANFEAITINQCAEDGSLFSNTHRCKRATTKCKNIPSKVLRVGSYACTCNEGFRFPYPEATNQFFEGQAVESAYMDYISNISSNYSSDFNCLTMHTSAPSSATLGSESILTFDFLARGIPLGVQSFCMTVSVVIGIVIVCLRKTKVMRSSIWILLEMLLLGAILLYATVVIQYFEPTTTRCLLLPWFREVGFVILYGVLVLKIYRILAEFQSRKAHRVHVKDKDLLKYLAVIMTVVIAYMSAWTAVNIDHLDNNSTMLERLHTQSDGLTYTLCRSMWWDYVIETGEFIFLCFGVYICYCVRSAPTEYSEGKFITGAICYEAIVSGVFYVLRHLWWYQMHPDNLFLMFFVRCQLTVTVVLLIILGPKLWYAHRPLDEDHARSRAYSQSDVQDSSTPETMKLNVGISSNGDVEVGEINLTEMDPEDIRAELKRLYTQLQIYKTKTMRKDNPHISKRRGGRKQTHRRFSLQAFHHKHRHHHDHDHDHEMSKTPEESTNSAEAMTFTIEPSVKEDPNEGRSLPSVSFKPGHK